MSLLKLMQRRDASPLVSWAVVTGLVAWGAYLLWHAGLVHRLVNDDPSHLSQVILVIYALTQAYAGRVAWLLQGDIARAHHYLASEIAEHDTDPLASWIRSRRTGADRGNRDDSPELDRILGQRLETGWFIADLMFKIGLVGTVIGFIAMLGAITDLKSLDIHQARQMLGEMSSGMRLALYTTLSGLCCGALTGIQFHLLERAANAASLDIAARARR